MATTNHEPKRQRPRSIITVNVGTISAAQNATGDRNSVKLGGLADTLWATAFFKISLILCGTTEVHRAKRVPLKNGRARNSGHFFIVNITLNSQYWLI